MASFKGNGRNQGRNRRRVLNTVNRRGYPRLEDLEDRTLLSATPTYTPWHPTDSNLADVQNGPMANEGPDLIHIYESSQQGDSTAQQLSQLYPFYQFQGNDVLVGVNSSGGDFNTFVSSLQNLGMQITTSSSYYGEADGWLPVAELPTVAEMPQTLAAHGIQKAITYASNYQGVANNEAQTSLFADQARTQYGVDGTGVTVGVLSDSVSQYAGGLADSVKTGDLPNNVDVIKDGPAGSTDEGRAMLENIHDIAPGASLQFATADGGDLAFANDILALQAAGSNIIADDVSYGDEPFFQDGQIAQAINTVVGKGSTYFGAAGNQANDGYLSNFRATTANITGLGQGTYMNFNPGGGTTTELPITVGAQASTNNPAEIAFQFDQPFLTQEPAGSTNGPTSEVDIDILDASGNIVAQGNANNVATQNPEQIVDITTPGNYFAVIKVVSGSNPGHVEFLELNENVDLTVSQQFGSSGGTAYPTSYGHHTAVNTIGVGATPWWAPQPYLGQNPLASEPFSSFGPAVYVFNANGVALSTPITVQAPVVTGPDGGNTSFFPPGGTIDTSNPPFPGEPATTTNLSQDLPSFFGTSSATPNVAAVAALMKQEVPTLTPAQIRAALIASTTPMDGSASGVWNQQAGYGLVNAVKAISAADVLRVASSIPTNNATLTVAPNGIVLTFNKPVVFSTVSAADLTFTSTPTGVTAVVGAPYPVTVVNGNVTSDAGDADP
ncbi:MAG: S8 family serine peptidase, partial [Isosphaeraceae bacterium]|nr:S8 family serine peptidase [Isosphaeraceae bacterium]